MTKRPLTRLDIKQAILTDHRFRELFPELNEDIAKVIQNPSCGCNIPIYDSFFKYKDRLKKYFSLLEVKEDSERPNKNFDSQNRWNIINCKASELEDVLNKLHKIGRVQIAVARYEDEVTVVVNDSGVII